MVLITRLIRRATVTTPSIFLGFDLVLSNSLSLCLYVYKLHIEQQQFLAVSFEPESHFSLHLSSPVQKIQSESGNTTQLVPKREPKFSSRCPSLVVLFWPPSWPPHKQAPPDQSLVSHRQGPFVLDRRLFRPLSISISRRGERREEVGDSHYCKEVSFYCDALGYRSTYEMRRIVLLEPSIGASPSFTPRKTRMMNSPAMPR